MMDAGEAAGGKPIYTVAYIQVAASAALQAATLARQLAVSGREEPGNAGFEALAEIGRPNRLALLARWHGEAAATAHAAGASARAFGDQLEPILASPFEVRSFDGLAVERPAGPGGPLAVSVLTHIDVFPAGKDRVADLARSLAETGRNSAGNLRFDVLRWAGHPNHFTLIEGWCHRDAFEASAMAAPTREFRQQLTPLEGALYDERLYHALR